MPAATILLVEDDVSLLTGISDLLEVADFGYEIDIIRAANGAAALQSMNTATPDLIISDVMMPLMNGFEFLDQVREKLEWVHIPFIFLTARGNRRDIREGRLSGAELYITKPFDSRELLELVKSQLDRSSRRHEARLQDLDTLKRDLLQLLNHEFRTPLTYVTAYSEMFSGGLESAEENEYLSEYLRGIQVGCVRLTKLVDDLVAVTALRTGETQRQLQQRARPITDIGRLVMEGIQAVQASAAEKNIAIESFSQGSPPAVLGDRLFLLDAIGRLLHNAIKFIHIKRALGQDAAGRIRVTTLAENGELRITVEDNGIGFPNRVGGQLFDLFYQHNRERLEQQGAGSGLTIARGLVELHRGRIEAQGEEGVGSTFTICLPLWTSSVNSMVPVASPRPPKKQATILVVEDDKYLLDGLVELLELYDEEYRFRVLSASNGLKALKVLDQQRPDLVVSDIMMPQMDGYQLLEQVRRNPEWVNVPFIFLTAKGERRDIHRGRLSGAEEYIVKPYDSDELLDLVVAQLKRASQVQGAVSQSFSDFKRGILDLLRPDFKTPLTSVSAYTEALLTDRLEASQTEEDVQQSLIGMQASSHRLTRLVEDLIALAELKTGESATAYDYRVQRLGDVGSMLREAGQRYEAAAAMDGITITYEHDAALPAVVGDRENLVNSLSRLVEAAVRLCRIGRGQRVALRATTRRGELCLAIYNNGAGYSVKEAAAITAHFEQGDESVMAMPEYGSALAIVRGIAALHGGRLELDNVANAACTVTMVLPAYNA